MAVDGTCWPERVGADEAATVVPTSRVPLLLHFHATEDGRQGMAATSDKDVTFYLPGGRVPVLAAGEGGWRGHPAGARGHDTIQDAVDVARAGRPGPGRP